MSENTRREPTAAEQVAEVAERQIEQIRLLLCPTEDDVTIADDGTLDTVVQLDDVEERYSQEFVADYRDDETGELDRDAFVEAVFDDLREQANERWHEHGLSFDYVDHRGPEHYFCYLISTGGPGTEIRFYANHDLTLYRAEFWYLPWFDGAHVVVTDNETVQAVWEQFSETGTAEHKLLAAIESRDS